MQYRPGILESFIQQEDQRVTNKISKDLGRTYPGTEEFKLPIDSG